MHYFGWEIGYAMLFQKCYSEIYFGHYHPKKRESQRTMPVTFFVRVLTMRASISAIELPFCCVINITSTRSSIQVRHFAFSTSYSAWGRCFQCNGTAKSVASRTCGVLDEEPSLPSKRFASAAISMETVPLVWSNPFSQKTYQEREIPHCFYSVAKFYCCYFDWLTRANAEGDNERYQVLSPTQPFQ